MFTTTNTKTVETHLHNEAIIYHIISQTW